jgi:hypothetical protein
MRHEAGQLDALTRTTFGSVHGFQPLHIAPHGGGGRHDVDVVAQMGHLPVAHGEHNDVGKRELAVDVLVPRASCSTMIVSGSLVS